MMFLQPGTTDANGKTRSMKAPRPSLHAEQVFDLSDRQKPFEDSVSVRVDT